MTDGDRKTEMQVLMRQLGEKGLRNIERRPQSVFYEPQDLSRAFLELFKNSIHHGDVIADWIAVAG